jgi:hypothetical protein
MTASTTLLEPHQAGPDVPLSPSDVLMNLIVAFLAPMFLGASGGDIGFARSAAIETVNAYRTRNHADLVAVAQVVAFGLAALGSLSLSMADDLSLSMILRLRGNANALDRSAERSRRVLRERRAGNAPPDQPQPERQPEADAANEAAPDEAALTAAVAAARQAAADVRTRIQAEAPPAPTTKPATKQHHQTTWAIAMADAAEKLTAGIDALPPAERRAASLRAATLASTATSLLSGISPPLDPAIRLAPRPPL